jgi:hypothetical protein
MTTDYISSICCNIGKICLYLDCGFVGSASRQNLRGTTRREERPTLASERFNHLHEAMKISHYIFLLKEIQKFHQNKKQFALNFNYISKVRETTNVRSNFVKQAIKHKILGLYSINTSHAGVYSSI